jgi:phosphoenolpyruvate synthase/pyruvate phosphate dikinase
MGTKELPINCAVRNCVWIYPRATPPRFAGAPVVVEIARSHDRPDFFSFGTNDLTQTTYGLSRDDAGRFLSKYVETKIMPDDPFQVLDREGVGELVRIGTERGRGVKPGLMVGICGEHGGEARSIAFCHETGLDYVSCSPFRVPVARLAAAQAALEAEAGTLTADK